jgi:hypothetical protein
MYTPTLTVSPLKFAKFSASLPITFALVSNDPWSASAPSVKKHVRFAARVKLPGNTLAT